MIFALKDILANPFRRIERYPILRKKIEALKESINTTTFWDNVVARLTDGKAEIAYGHHRLAALREIYEPKHKIELIIRDLDDAQMIKIMARENMEEWGTSAQIEHETVRAAVQAYAEGKVDFPTVESKTSKNSVRCAPSFVRCSAPSAEHQYTAQTVAQFLGWTQPGGDASGKVKDAIAALELIEEGVLDEEVFNGLSSKQAHAVIVEARKAKTRTSSLEQLQAKEAKEEARAARARARAATSEQERLEAKGQAKAAREREKKAKQKIENTQPEARRRASEVGRAVSEEIKSGRIGFAEADKISAETTAKKRQGPPPDINDFAENLAIKLAKILDPNTDESARRLNELIKFKEYADNDGLVDLAKTLEGLSARALRYANAVRPAANGQQQATSTGRRLITSRS